MASAQIERPREENIKWREAVVKIDSDTFMRVQYLFTKEISDYKTLADLVMGGYDFGRAWVVNARDVTAENASSQDWRAYASRSRAAANLLEQSGESEIISKREGITHVTDAQKEHFQALLDMTAASVEFARNPHDQDALFRLNDAMHRLGLTGRAEGREGRERGEEEAPTHVEEAAPPEAPVPKGTFSKEAEAALSETAQAAKGVIAGKAESFEFFTPDDPRGISYGFEIHWKDGYVPKGEYDRSDIWSTERFLFANLDGIDYYGITGFVDGRLDGSGIRQFSGESFSVEYLRRAFLRLEDEIGGDTVRLYVPRALDVSGKTLADLINSPDVVAMSVVEEGGEKFIWDIYAKEQEELLAALQKRFPDMEFVQA